MTMEFSDTMRDQITSDLVTAWNAELGGSASIFLFDGFKPALCSDPDDGTILAIVGMNGTPFATPSANVFNANSMSAGTGLAAGNMSYFRMKDGSTNVVAQGTVSSSAGANIVFNTVVVAVSDNVEIDSFTATVLLVGGP